MECNRDDAIRAKENAEKMFLQGDITAAKKFALKARDMFPNLDGLSQFIDVIDVHIWHENKQYYQILGVDPLSSEDVLHKHYRKRALAIHPDKNKSIGAEEAFKILSEAWSVLQDTEQRRIYDWDRNMGAPSNANTSFTSSHVPTHDTPRYYHNFFPDPTYTPFAYTQHDQYSQYESTSQYASAPECNPSFFTPFAPQPTNPVPYTSQTEPVPEYNPRQQFNQYYTEPMIPQTFWARCHRCSIEYEYDKIYLNQNLLCIFCQKPFLGTEIPAPDVSRPRVRPWSKSQQRQGVFPASGSNSKTGESLKRRHT